MGRKPLQIEEEKKVALEQYASIGCTIAEMASYIGVSEKTLERHVDLGGFIKKGKETGKRSLRQRQFEMAMGRPREYMRDKVTKEITLVDGKPVVIREEIKPNVVMLIWLGKQLLGQSDKFTVQDGDGEGFDFGR